MVADVNRLRVNGPAERCLSRFILSVWALAEPYAFEFQSPEQRIVLVSVEALEQLAEQIGLLCYADSIRLCVRRDERARLVQALGETRRQRAIAAAVRYGNAIKGLAADPATSCADQLSLERIRAHGWRRVAPCARTAAEAARRRFELKLPLGIELDGAGNENGPTVWPLVERVLKSEFRGEWQACCC